MSGIFVFIAVAWIAYKIIIGSVKAQANRPGQQRNTQMDAQRNNDRAFSPNGRTPAPNASSPFDMARRFVEAFETDETPFQIPETAAEPSYDMPYVDMAHAVETDSLEMKGYVPITQSVTGVEVPAKGVPSRMSRSNLFMAATSMRRAVIMAEVLAPPKALRKRESEVEHGTHSHCNRGR